MTQVMLTKVIFQVFGFYHTRYTELTDSVKIDEAVKQLWETAHVYSMTKEAVNFSEVKNKLL